MFLLLYSQVSHYKCFVCHHFNTPHSPIWVGE